MKSLVFADIHGQYDELMLALECAGYEDEDRLIGLGDYIDYGSQSKEVLDFLVSAQKLNPRNIWIRGNHENQLLYSLERNSERSLYAWLDSLLGRTTLVSYNAPLYDADDVKEYLQAVFPPDHLRFLQETVEFYDEGDYHFTHMLEFRSGLITVHGHEHEHRPIVGFHRISLSIDYGVAVLDMDKGIIHDNEGREYVVTKQRLFNKHSTQEE